MGVFENHEETTMTEKKSLQVTLLLNQASRGDRRASDALVPLVYDELQGRARKLLSREGPVRPIDTVPLVHEAYLRLVNQSKVEYQGRTHFLALAAIQMRRILVDEARKRKARVHGGGLARITLHEELVTAPEKALDLLDLEEALEELTRLNPRQGRLIELRFYSGQTVKETAETLGIAVGTAEKDWRMARAWLERRLEGGHPS